MNKLSSQDRAALIRLASSLPAGDENRKAILAGLAGTGKTAAPKTRKTFEALIGPALGMKNPDFRRLSYDPRRGGGELEAAIYLYYGDRRGDLGRSWLTTNGWTMKDFVEALEAAGAKREKPKPRVKKQPLVDYDGWAY